jgi:hypothetical protein
MMTSKQIAMMGFIVAMVAAVLAFMQYRKS